ncbi:MAG: ice-binding family protein [Candidatus Paceibacterota bacterium]|jgi:hypothetical protein
MKIFNKVLVGILAVSFVLGFSGAIVALAAGPAKVNLGSAGNFTILSKTGISTTGSTSIIGDIGVSPISASAITGFALTLPAASAFSTSALVTGKVYAADYTAPTPTTMTTAVSDMQTAYTDAVGRASDVTELGAGNIGGLTIAPGVYKWGTGVTIPTNVTLSGGANDVWIFQVAQNLNISSAAHILLSGGAEASNIFWVVAGQTTIGTTAVFNGNILDQTAIVLNTGATLNGRALAQTAVTLDSNAVIMPTSAATTPAVPATPATSATPAAPTVNPATPAVSATPATPASPTPTQTQTSTLTAKQLQQYNQLISAGASPSTALNAANQISPSTNPGQATSLPSASAFGQQVRAIAISLGQGGRGNDVTTLQQFLISQNKGSAAQDLAKVGATAYFGVLTRAALAEFQAKVGINPPLGNFGPITRDYLKANY